VSGPTSEHVRVAEADLRCQHGVAEALGVLGGEAHEVVHEGGIVDCVQAHDLGVAHEHGDGPRPHQDGPQPARELRRGQRLALFEERGKPAGAIRIGDFQRGELALVLLEHVLVDGRHHVIGVLHVTADRLRLLGEVVEGDQDVGLVALVVVEHGLDGLRGVRAVLLDGEAVETAREGPRDGIGGHAIREPALVGGDHTIPRRDGFRRLHGRLV
jgi:hypothetical protein